MASSYPGAVDALTNPTATDAMNSVTVPHATQHANANDAIEAIQTELGTDPAGGSATVKARFDVIEATGWVTSTRIADGTIVDADVNAAAAIAQSKIASLTTDLAGKAATVGLWLPGSGGNYCSAPDSAGLSITGDTDVRCRIAATDWTPAVANDFLTKWDSTVGGRSWLFRVVSGGNLNFTWSNDGSATTGNVNSTAALGLTDGAAKWVRAALDVDDGGVYKVYFYTSDDGTTWTQLGTTVSGGATTSIHDSATEVRVSGFNASGSSEPFAGVVYRAQILNGIGGSAVADLNLANGVGPRIRDSLGNLWTINGTANGWQI